MLNIFLKILKSWITMQTKIEELKPSSTYFLIVPFCEIQPRETEESPLSHFQLSKHCSNTCAKWIQFHFLTAQVRKNEEEKKKKKEMTYIWKGFSDKLWSTMMTFLTTTATNVCIPGQAERRTARGSYQSSPL